MSDVSRRLSLLMQSAVDCQQTLAEVSHIFGGGNTAAALNQLKSELPQIRYVLHQMSNESETHTHLAEIAASLLCTAVRLSEVTFSRDERLSWFAALAKHSKGFVDPELRGQLLGNFGNALAECGRLNEAEAVLIERLDEARHKSDSAAVGLAKEHLGKLLLRRGRFNQADQLLEESYIVAQSLADSSAVLRLLKDRADAAFRNDDMSEGIRLLEERLQRSNDTKDLFLILSTSQVLAERLLIADRLEDAAKYAQSAAAIARRLRLPLRIAATRGTLGNIALERGDFALAKKHFMAARRVFRKHGRAVEQSMTASSLGFVSWKTGHLRQAARWMRTALDIDRGMGRMNDVAIDLGNLAEVLAELGDAKQTISCHLERVEVLESIGEHTRAADTQLAVARLAAGLGRTQLAILSCQRAAAYYSEHDHQRATEITNIITQLEAPR